MLDRTKACTNPCRQPIVGPRSAVVSASSIELTALVDAARAGRGGAATVVGDPGIGKTAVLDALAARAASARVVRLTGVEAEVEMGWSGLAVLVEGFLDGIERLAPARATALRTALALETADEAVAPFAVALATRDLLVEAAEDTPILVLVDDLQWIDHSTRRTLAFLARRLEVERLAIVSTRRVGGDPSADTGRAIALTALDADDADELLADVGVNRSQRAGAVVRAVEGTPLVLVWVAHPAG